MRCSFSTDLGTHPRFQGSAHRGRLAWLLGERCIGGLHLNFRGRLCGQQLLVNVENSSLYESGQIRTLPKKSVRFFAQPIGSATL